MSYLSELNDSQREAVTTLSGPLLVLAGAGSGKTRVITYRMAELIRRGTPPSRILSVTFTNKASREMQERAAKLLGGARSERPLVSTFHSLCMNILRGEIGILGYPANFAIYDRGDQEAMARTALRDLRVPEKSLSPGGLLASISRWKGAGIGPEQARDAVDSDLDALAAAGYRRYQTGLRAAGAVDFDDLLFLTDQLFRQHPDVLTRQQERFDKVQIDEYQDTNGLQFRLIEALVRPHRNLCVVGDDDQAIYGWRGADVKHILAFPQQFPEAKVIRLVDNYRSTQQILQMANTLVSNNRLRHGKQLQAHKDNPASVRIKDYPDAESEALDVVREIAWLIRQKNVDPGDIAILFRTNEQPRLFETELRRAQVPYVLLGSQSFFDRREIRDLLAYLRVCSRPEDEIPLLRIINVPPRGIGAGTVEKLVRKAATGKRRIWHEVQQAQPGSEFAPAAATALAGFRDLVHKYRVQFAQNPRDLGGTLERLIHEIDYHAEIEKQYEQATQHELRRTMVGELVQAVRHYESRAAQPTLSGFLQETTLAGREDEPDKDEQLQARGVKLMTLHSAKGLEFPRVYLVGMEEGLLPHKRSVEEGGGDVDEERRLAYVGVTRARDFLCVSRANTRIKWGKPRLCVPSRFIFEMQGQPVPPQVLQRHDD
jgi:DNA helicase-2/ATP-dependent DNA helicase PcrA